MWGESPTDPNVDDIQKLTLFIEWNTARAGQQG
jgi:hypothetical protein